MRQKKWRRWGIALSTLWLLAAGYWGLNTGLHKGDFAATRFDLCVENSRHPENAGGKCLIRFEHDYPQAIQSRWWRALIAGVVPIPIAWFLVYGFARIGARRGSGWEGV